MIYEKEHVMHQWTKLLGDRAILVSDVTKIPEIIVSILEIAAGKDAKKVIDSWDGSTAIAVRTAIGKLSTLNASEDLIEF